MSGPPEGWGAGFITGLAVGAAIMLITVGYAKADTLTVQHTSRITGITKMHIENVKSCTAVNKIRTQSLGTIKAWCNGRRV